MQPLRPNAGMTLVELIISLTILAILAGMAAPSMQHFVQRQRISAASFELVAAINFARQHAVAKREYTVLCPSADGRACSGDNQWHRGWIVFRDRNRDRSVDAESEILRIGAPLHHIHADSAGRTHLRFMPSGFAYGTNLTIKLCDLSNPDNSRAITVSNSGRARTGELPGHLDCPGAG